MFNKVSIRSGVIWDTHKFNLWVSQIHPKPNLWVSQI